MSDNTKRKFILQKMLESHSLIEIIDCFDDASIKGFVFETIACILILTRDFELKFPFEILDGNFNSYPIFQPITSVKQILNCNIVQGNNPSDITIRDFDNNIIPFSSKYYNKINPNQIDVNRLYQKIIDVDGKTIKDCLVGLIVKNKSDLINHTFNHKKDMYKQYIDDIISKGLLFDLDDLEMYYQQFLRKYSNREIDELITFLDENILNNKRKILKLKLHQQMFRKKLLANINKGRTYHLIYNKPRSGKSILILSTVKQLLTNNKRVLIMTSVPSTIDDFIRDLETYIEFKDIKYLKQDSFKSIDDDFTGIIFTSVQYLKNDKKTNTSKKPNTTKKTVKINKKNTSLSKKEILKNLNIDVCVFDESHNGSSNEKTNQDIISYIKCFRKDVPIIFASGTGNKTKNFYQISPECVYEWDIEDESYMKIINKDGMKQQIIDVMENKHGNLFTECLQDPTLNKDYTSCPVQVLLQPTILRTLLETMNTFNNVNNENYGYNIGNILALKQKVRSKNTEQKYEERFQICTTEAGKQYLIKIFNTIISNSPMDDTVMKLIEKTQTYYKSRKSTLEDPKLFIVYLPTNNGLSEINTLQKTICKFLHDNNLWTEYQLEYYNSTSNSGDYNLEYNVFLRNIMQKTKGNKKKGCILFLGDVGGLGITYDKCDATISLDNGQNLDKQKQRNYRALTAGKDKTIGINVDMNLQRVYNYVQDTIIRHKKNTNSSKDFVEILQYLYEHKIFIFNPTEFNLGVCKSSEITSYFKHVSDDLVDNIDEDIIMDRIECEDVLKDSVKIKSIKSKAKKQNSLINKEVVGVQQDCPSGGTTKTEVDPMKNVTSNTNQKEEEENKQIMNINNTKELYKKLVPILSLIKRTEREKRDLITILFDEKYESIFVSVIEKIFDISKTTITDIKTCIGEIMYQ